MPIDIKNADVLNAPIIEGAADFDGITLDYDGEVPDGEYLLTLAKVYPWKQITKDSNVSVRDENNKVVKDDKGNRVKELVKDLEWFNANVVFAVAEGPYEGNVVHGSLSTHPDMMGQLKSFMYCAGLFQVTAGDVYKHVGAEVGAVVKNRTRTYTDSNTGMDKTISEASVYYFKKPSEIETAYDLDSI